VLDIAFHPSRNIICCALIDGSVLVYEYGVNENRLLRTIQNHKTSCRAIQLNETRLFSASKDKSLNVIDLETGNIEWKLSKAHPNPINTMLLEDNFIFTGDDEGMIKVFDIREKKEIRCFKENEDYISDLVYSQNLLLCTSGDGTIAAYNVNQNKMVGRSDNLEDELLSITLLRNGTKVVCGSQDGIINIYNWGQWSDISDRFPGHPGSIDCIARIDDNIICTGSSDGLIRIVNILPNKLLGVLGEHEDYPVEVLTINHDNKYMASCSHEDIVKFWNIEFFYNLDDGDQKMDEIIESKYEEHKDKKDEMKQFFSDL